MNREQANDLMALISPVLDRTKASNLRVERLVKGSREWVVCVRVDTEITEIAVFSSWEEFIASGLYVPLKPLRDAAEYALGNEGYAKERYIGFLRDIKRSLSDTVRDIEKEIERAEAAVSAVLREDKSNDSLSWTAKNQGEGVASQLIWLLPNLQVGQLQSAGYDWLIATQQRINADRAYAAAEGDA